jgi:hypothetical protein
MIDHYLDNSESSMSFQELANFIAPKINVDASIIYDYLLNEKQMMRRFRHRVQKKVVAENQKII